MRHPDPFGPPRGSHRGRLYLWERHRIIELESPDLRIRLSASRGAEVQDILHKGSDADLLWSGHDRIRRAVQGIPSTPTATGSFLDNFSGGWQSVIPSAQFPVAYRDAALGQHGEAALAEWDLVDIDESPTHISVTLATELLRTPLKVTKTLVLQDARLTIAESVTNLASTEVQFQWGHHIALAGALAAPGAELVIPSRPRVEIPDSTSDTYRFEGGSTQWPDGALRDGTPTDLSRLPDDDGTEGHFVLGPMTNGEVRVIGTGSAPQVTVSWDADLLPYCWVWMVFRGHPDWPMWGRHRLITIEPFTSELVSLDEARETGQVVSIQPGGTATTTVSLDVQEPIAPAERTSR